MDMAVGVEFRVFLSEYRVFHVQPDKQCDKNIDKWCEHKKLSLVGQDNYVSMNWCEETIL